MPHFKFKPMGKADFSQGRVSTIILRQSIPLALAQLVHLLYNIVDRIYIGHMPEQGTIALTGLSITFPLISIIGAFTNLFGMGGTPLFSIKRGEGRQDTAELILGNTFALLLLSSLLLMTTMLAFRRSLLFLFGASDVSYTYADAYLKIYLLGTPFAMLSTGLNGFINAQGFPVIGMLTTLIGAIINLVLDPLFIFVFRWGVKGAALATVIAQCASCIWALVFLFGRRAPCRIRIHMLRIHRDISTKIILLGSSGFMMQATNGVVQGACTSTLQGYGGDLYVSLFTILCSVRDLITLPISGLTSGSQPVLGYNYGAKRMERVREGIRFVTILGFIYTLIAWIIIMLFPKMFLRVFSDGSELILIGVSAMRIFFAAFFFMVFQFAGQSVFQGLGFAKYAIFFSILRKIVIVVPLTLLLPRIGLGVNGVFLAEPISDILGGTACYLTMKRKVYHHLGESSLQEDR